MQDLLIVPYGVDTFSLASVRIEAGTRRPARVAAPFPCIAIDPTAATPLRLNNAVYPAWPASSNASVLDILQANIRQSCGLWNKLSHAFCQAYFAFLSAQIEAGMPALMQRAEPFTGLFSPADWLYSAPRPLPRAHVFAPAGEPTGTEADYVQVDFAFWLGTQFSVAIAAPGALTPARAKAREERLAQAGTAVVHFTARDLLAPEDLFLRILGAPPAHYWNSEPIPVGPFRPAGLGGPA